MNAILKKILGVAEAVVVATVPGAGPVDKAAREIIKASNGEEKAEAIFATGVASLQLIENLGAVDFANEPDFQTGLSMAKAGFTLMAKAVKTHEKPVPPTA